MDTTLLLLSKSHFLSLMFVNWNNPKSRELAFKCLYEIAFEKSAFMNSLKKNHISFSTIDLLMRLTIKSTIEVR